MAIGWTFVGLVCFKDSKSLRSPGFAGVDRTSLDLELDFFGIKDLFVLNRFWKNQEWNGPDLDRSSGKKLAIKN